MKCLEIHKKPNSLPFSSKRFAFSTMCAIVLGATLSACSSEGGGTHKAPVVTNPPVDDPPVKEPPVDDPPVKEPPNEVKDYPAVEAFLEKVEKALAGETVDFTGSGSTSRIWFDEKGVRHFEGKGPSNNPYRYASETHPDDSYKITYSAYDDGILDHQEEQHVDGTRVTLYDTDRDGVFDKRKTLMVTEDPTFFRAIDEERTPEGEWKEVRNELVPTTVESLSEDAESNNADAMNEPQLLMRAPNEMLGIRFTTSGHGACSPEEQSRTKEAISGILENSLACLSATRPAMAKRILDAYAGKHHVAFYCGFENDPFASTLSESTLAFARPYISKGWTCSARFPCVIKVRRDQFNAPSFQETLLHELLHTLGFNLGNAAEHDKGEDETYSCGRYCAGCTTGGPGFTTSNVDCTRCADTPERKKKCNPTNKEGTMEMLITGPCPEHFGVQRNLCGSGLACLGSAQRCEACQYIEYADCDGNKTGKYGRLLCCQTCPSNCSFNPLPCSNSEYLLLGDTCHLPPPFCPGGAQTP